LKINPEIMVVSSLQTGNIFFPGQSSGLTVYRNFSKIFDTLNVHF